MLETPVVLIIFNRPGLTKQIFEQIRAARPSKLFVISDAAREWRIGEKALVDECRDVINSVDWPCSVQIKIADQNLGCRRSVSEGLTWVFSQVERAIILEDDCLPSKDFFDFCDTLLSEFTNDFSVGSICGSNLDSIESAELEGSYYYSNFPSVWGWATWKRVWDLYEVDLSTIQTATIKNVVNKQNISSKSKVFWLSKLRSVRKSRIDTWDYQLVFTHWLHGLTSIISKENLISNLGFGEDATHTSDTSSVHSSIRISSLSFPLELVDKSKAKTQLEMNIGLSRFEASYLRIIIEELSLYTPKNIQSLIKKFYLKIFSRPSGIKNL